MKIIKLFLFVGIILALVGCSSRFAYEYVAIAEEVIEEISEIPDRADSASIQTEKNPQNILKVQ